MNQPNTVPRHARIRRCAGRAALIAALAGAGACGDDNDTADVTTTTTAAPSADETTTSAASSDDTTTTTAASSSGDATVEVADSSLGQIFVDSEGMTLYAFSDDTPLTSECNGGCATAWPPLLSDTKPTSEGEVGMVVVVTINRDDGAKQVKIKTHPVYRFAGDSAPGDTNGQGSGGKWHVLDANGDLVTSG